MKRHYKTIGVFIIFIIIFASMTASFAFASEKTTDNPDCKIHLKEIDSDNRQITVDITVAQGVNIAAGAFTIGYNKSQLTYLGLDINPQIEAEGGSIFVNDTLDNGEIVFSYLNATPTKTKKTFMTLTFGINPGFYGNTAITIIGDDATDIDYNLIKLDYHNLQLNVPQDKTVTKNPFTDVKVGSYFYEPVLWALENGITDGISPTKFGPAQKCTRGQVVTFLWRTIWCPKPLSKSTVFVDIEKNAYYKDAVLWAFENGITDGTAPNKFSPNANVTRAQFVTFLWRMNGQPEVNGSNPFKDVPKNEYYTKAVIWAYENGITDGVSPTSFAPNAVCLRQEVVTFLYRAFN